MKKAKQNLWIGMIVGGILWGIFLSLAFINIINRYNIESYYKLLISSILAFLATISAELLLYYYLKTSKEWELYFYEVNK